MSSDEYHVHNIYRYSRKSFKKSKRATTGNDDICSRESVNIDTPENGLRNDPINCTTGPGSSYDIDAETEIANILNKKCPVINLAQKQLRSLLEETDRLLCGENTRCCRTLYDFLRCIKYFLSLDTCRCFLLILVVVSFVMGIIFGAASCGDYHGRFNSPILQCVDHFFIPNSYPRVEDTFRSIV